MGKLTDLFYEATFDRAQEETNTPYYIYLLIWITAIFIGWLLFFPTLDTLINSERVPWVIQSYTEKYLIKEGKRDSHKTMFVNIDYSYKQHNYSSIVELSGFWKKWIEGQPIEVLVSKNDPNIFVIDQWTEKYTNLGTIGILFGIFFLFFAYDRWKEEQISKRLWIDYFSLGQREIEEKVKNPFRSALRATRDVALLISIAIIIPIVVEGNVDWTAMYVIVGMALVMLTVPMVGFWKLYFESRKSK